MKEIVKINGIELWYESFGDIKKECILLIAGAMAPATFWQENFCNALAKDYFVIRFDNRDFGYSTHFEEVNPPPYTIYDMVEDVRGLLEYLKAEKAHIVGHSLGGSIAQLFAVKYPEKTLSLTPISSPVIAKGDLKFIQTPQDILNEMWEVLMENPCHQDFENGVNGFMKSFRYLNGKKDFDYDMAFEYIKRIYETQRIIRPHLNHTNIQNDIEDIYDKLYKLSIPIHFIYGSEDYLAASGVNTMILAKSLINARYTQLEDVGHMFFNKDIWNDLSRLVPIK